MSEMTFSEVLNTVQGDDGHYTAIITDNWLQGRAAFGGLGVAVGIRALMLHSGEERSIRSVMVSFVGPLKGGECDIHVRTLRSGKSVAQYTVEITQNGEFVTQVGAVFGLSRDEIGIESEVRTDLPDLNKFPIAPFIKGIMPNFMKYLENRWCGNGMPISGTKDSSLNMWARIKEDLNGYDFERMIAMADMPPPIMMSHYSKPAVASSLTWKIEFISQPADMNTDWFYLDYILEGAEGGYSQQAGRIYSEDGRLLMLSHQCMCYFGGKSFG